MSDNAPVTLVSGAERWWHFSYRVDISRLTRREREPFKRAVLAALMRDEPASDDQTKMFLIQLAQAVGGGVLRVEEFRSMAHAMPRLAAAMVEDSRWADLSAFEAAMRAHQVSSDDLIDLVISASERLYGSLC